MKNPYPNKLPSKSGITLVIVGSVFGYAVLEYFGICTNKAIPPEVKLIITRAGIFSGYLGALVGGLLFYWDGKAKQVAVWADQQKQYAEIDNSIKNQSVVQTMEAEINRVDEYIQTKPWLGKVAIALVVISFVLQSIGAT